MRATRLTALSLATALTCGCYTRAEQLSQSWELDRLRILGVRAEPAEPRPGDTVSFDSLVYSPEDNVGLVVWFACLPDSASSFGCSVDPALLEELSSADPANMSSEELAALTAQLEAAGLVGAEPFLPPSWDVPTDALDGLDEQAALEGVNAIVNLQAIPDDAEDDSDIEIAYKRVPVSLAVTPNHNPDLVAMVVDDVAIEDGATVTADRGAALTLAPTLSDDAIEDYTYVNSDGGTEERTEEPYFTWYATGGDLDPSFTLCDEAGTNAERSCPDAPTTWTAPEEAFEGQLFVVVRDRRGGMGWTSVNVSVP